jgi:integrase
MSVYKRGQTYWYKFLFQGQLIRDSAKTNSKTVAREAERARRRELELAVNRIPKRDRTPLFGIAAREWLASKNTLAPKSLERFQHHVVTLTVEFGQRLICDVTADDVLRLRSKRISEGLAPRTVNYEIAALRGILKSKGFWGGVLDELERRGIKKLPERHDVGRAISSADEQKLLDAIAASRSPALLPLFILAIDTGLRASELRSLTRRDPFSGLGKWDDPARRAYRPKVQDRRGDRSFGSSHFPRVRCSESLVLAISERGGGQLCISAPSGRPWRRRPQALYLGHRSEPTDW